MKYGANIKLGLFVTLGILLLIGAVYYMGKQQNLFGSTFRLTGIFSNVSGLQVGNNVRFSGINVGTVENIEIISDSSVRVDLIIDEKVREFIKKDAKAVIGSEGLMGNRIVNITGGSSGLKQVQHNDIIQTVKPIDTEDIFKNLVITGENAAIITSELAKIMLSISEGKSAIGKLFIDTVFAEHLEQTIENVKKGTQGFSQNMEAAKSSIFLKGYFKKKKENKNKKQKKAEAENK